MLEELFSGTLATEFSVGHTLLTLGCALILGLAISGVYILTHRKEGYSGGLPITLVIMPATVAIIILLVGNNIAGAFTLAGAFSLVRFRAATGSAKDVAYVFMSVAIGLASGLGFIGYGIMFAAVLGLVMAVLSAVRFGQPAKGTMQLKITLPENLDFESAFDDIFEKYTESVRRIKARTVDFGSFYEICYTTKLKRGVHEKEFIDALRCRNGNMNITLTAKEYSDEAYPF